MGSIEILSPVAAGPTGAQPLNPRLPALGGTVLGFRVDRAWPSWSLAAGELADLARSELGVRDVVVFDPGSRIGRPEDESHKVAAFARTVDAAVVGLGT
jgi:hypothetical protein